MKKVLLISPQPFFQWRGSPIRVGFNVLALTKLGYHVDLLTLPIGEKREIQGARIIRVVNLLGVKNVPIGPSLVKLFFDFFILFKGIQLCFKNRYDVIHGIEEAGIIAAFLARLIGAKAVFEKHSDPFSYKKGALRNFVMNLYAAIELIAVKKVNGVIGTGPGLVTQVNKMGTNTRAFHIFDIPSSLSESDPLKVTRVRESLQKNSNEVLVTFVGSFAVYQGVDLMFSAVKDTLEKCPQVRFVVIGGNAEEIKQRQHYLQQRGVADKVTFLGKISPDILPDYLCASDVLLSPRISGVNTPLKILDYMKAGKSIVATDVPANQLLLDKDTAVLAEPEPVKFAEALAALANDTELRARLGNCGRKLYENKYNFREYQKRLAVCYDYILQL